MKVGDIVRSTKIRPKDTAEITEAHLSRKFNKKKNRAEVRTTYFARFGDGTSYKFYGFDVGKSVFKVVESDGQLCLSDFMDI